MKRVFVSGPIRKGVIDYNVAHADDAMLALLRAGIAVFNPMLCCYAGAARRAVDNMEEGYAFWYEPHPVAHGEFKMIGYERWMEVSFAWVEVCDALLRLPGESSGADAEVCHAQSKGIPVFHDVDEVIRWATT